MSDCKMYFYKIALNSLVKALTKALSMLICLFVHYYKNSNSEVKKKQNTVTYMPAKDKVECREDYPH